MATHLTYDPLIHHYRLQPLCELQQQLARAARGLLVVPRHRLSSYGRWAFSVAGPVIWNWLPDSLRDPAISRDSFKRLLKTFFYFQLIRVHSALELFGRYALQIYLLTYLARDLEQLTVSRRF